ncbi:hypothetical protein DH2020_010444 [Rehmannia glutinosa]|uniref:Ankyrin repeat domain-containing protein n=1 Tax=Rehmannia glutinosa TaxID=99300 RepID=A0ABR0XBD9_REHGL
MEDLTKYAHSPAHLAVLRRDYATLKRIVAALPQLAKAGEVTTEAESLASEEDADAVSAVIDRRDVPGRETPLHLAVRLHDAISAEILMAAGADWSLQNENGWSALQEAVCTREESIAMIIARHYQPLAWAKWCRRLPRIVASAARIRDFYMEITFHFESSVIPFIGRIAPSTLTVYGNVVLISGRYDPCRKEITNALEGAGVQPSEAEVAHEVALMSQTNMYRPGIDVSVKSRRVPGAMTDEELFSVNDDDKLANGGENDEYDDVLTAEERMQLDSALCMGDGFGEDEDSEVQDCHENIDAGSFESCESNATTKEKKSWFGWNKKSSKNLGDDPEDSKILKKFSKLAPDDTKQKPSDTRRSSSEFPREDMGDPKNFPLKTEELLPLLDILANKVKAVRRLRELLTTKLPPGTFPVKVGISNNSSSSRADNINNVFDCSIVGAIEFATTWLYCSTIAIPIVPTIRVLVTFTKFEELQPMEEFSTPLSSPAHFQDSKANKESEGSTSWISWMRGSRGGQSSDSESRSFHEEVDPFHIPSDYAWVDANEKKRRMKAKKAKNKKHKKHGTARNLDGARRLSEDVE